MGKNIKLMKRNPLLFDSLELFTSISREKKLTFDNTDDIANFAQEINETLENRISPKLLYGKRIEKMFSYVIASLGKCKLIKSEDGGDIFTDEDMSIPDYRIILDNNNQFLVEVKSFYQKEITTKYKLSIKEFNKYKAYSNLVNQKLYFAIFWTRCKTWTVVDSDKFMKENNNMTISLETAILNNHMSLFGDYMVATVPPLSIRIYSDKNSDRTIKDNHFNLTIKEVKFYYNNTLITDKEEQNIMYNLILFGKWCENCSLHYENDTKNIDYIEFSYEPEEYDKKQEFAIVANASEIISNQFVYSTSNKEGKINKIVPFGFSNKFGLKIKNPYIKKDLPLWIFYIQNK